MQKKFLDDLHIIHRNHGESIIYSLCKCLFFMQKHDMIHKVLQKHDIIHRVLQVTVLLVTVTIGTFYQELNVAILPQQADEFH